MAAAAATRRAGAAGDVTVRHQGPGGELCASVDLTGGGLRSLTFGGVDLVESYAHDQLSPACSGAVLFPWPNRVRGGLWSQRGAEHQLAITEPELRNANHGLVLNERFLVASHTASDAVVSVLVAPQPGYPFALTMLVRYSLTDTGLEVTHTLTNESGWPAPVALGVHPYLRIGEVAREDLTVQVRARTYLEVDHHLIPVGEHVVSGSAVDLRNPRRVGDLDLNTCFGGLTMLDGRSSSLVAAPDGRAVEIWADAAFAYVQVYTCPVFPRAEGTGLGLAIEPMTAPADALNSGAGLTWLDAGETCALSWGIRPIGRPDAWTAASGGLR
ncbi:MAG: aldose 1-epimerase family protein [Cellulomonas sp.]